MDKIYATIDRFEGKYAVCELETLKYKNILISDLPKGAKEGDTLLIEGKKITIDTSKTNERKKYIDEITKDLWM